MIEYKIKDLVKLTNMSKSTLIAYIGRAEFSHIKNTRGIYTNVNQEDIDRLNILREARKERLGLFYV